MTRSDLAEAQVRRKRLVATAQAAQAGTLEYTEDLNEITQKTAALSAAAAVAAIRASSHELDSDPPEGLRKTAERVTKHGRTAIGVLVALGTLGTVVADLLGLFGHK